MTARARGLVAWLPSGYLTVGTMRLPSLTDLTHSPVFVNVNVDVGDSSGIKVAGQALAEGAPGGGVEGEFIHCLSPYIGDVFVP